MLASQSAFFALPGSSKQFCEMTKSLANRRATAAAKAAAVGRPFVKRHRWKTENFVVRFIKGPSSLDRPSSVPLNPSQRAEHVERFERQMSLAKIFVTMSKFPEACSKGDRCWTKSRPQQCRHHARLWWERHGASWHKTMQFDNWESSDEGEVESALDDCAQSCADEVEVPSKLDEIEVAAAPPMGIAALWWKKP